MGSRVYFTTEGQPDSVLRPLEMFSLLWRTAITFHPQNWWIGLCLIAMCLNMQEQHNWIERGESLQRNRDQQITHSHIHILWVHSIDIMVVYYCTNCIFYPLNLTLHLNLPLTQSIFTFSNTSVIIWFISLFAHGDQHLKVGLLSLWGHLVLIM